MSRNIVLMTPLPPPSGGIGRWAERYINCAKGTGINILVVDESRRGASFVFGKKSKLSIFKQFKRNKIIWSDLKNVLVNNKIEVVHCNIPAYTLSMLRELKSLKIAKKYGVKFVFHFHCTTSNTVKGMLSKHLFKKCLRKSDGVIVLNEKSKEFAKAICPNANVEIIPNFVAENELYIERTIHNDIKKILYVGGVVPEKGCDTIVRVAKQYKNALFVLIGNSSESIIDLVTREKLENIQLLGEQPKEVVEREMKDSDVFLFLTRFRAEGFSIALTEALGSGLPCIVTDWAANKEQVGEYADMVVVSPNSYQEVLVALKRIESKAVRERISAYNIKRVKEKYTEKTVVASYLSFYENILVGMEND